MLRTSQNILFLIPVLGLSLISCGREQPAATQLFGPTASQLRGSSEVAVPAPSETPVPSLAEEEVLSPPETQVPSPPPALQTHVREHGDHNPKHGGTFFMALDGIHHLEGVLVPPGTFRVYLSDARTLPLDPARVKQASGTVQWGESEHAPEIPLVLGEDGQTLEAVFGNEVKFPVTLTLLLRLPGMPPDARPELFTFPFSDYSEERQYDLRYLAFVAAALVLLFLLVQPLQRYKEYRKSQLTLHSPTSPKGLSRPCQS